MEPSPQLSSREWEVANLLRQGKSNKVIASSLGISVRTVEFHLKNIYDKFQVSSRVELVLKLGESTVAEKEESAENRDIPNSSNWYTSLIEAVSKIGKEFHLASISNSNTSSTGSTMTFFEALRVCFTKYAEFNGRATRPEFWWFTLFVTLVASALMYMNQNLTSVFLIAMLLPFLAAGARRLHDIGKSGWWQLFLLVPAAGFIVVGVLWAKAPTSSLPDETSLA